MFSHNKPNKGASYVLFMMLWLDYRALHCKISFSPFMTFFPDIHCIGKLFALIMIAEVNIALL